MFTSKHKSRKIVLTCFFHFTSFRFECPGVLQISFGFGRHIITRYNIRAANILKESMMAKSNIPSETPDCPT